MVGWHRRCSLGHIILVKWRMRKVLIKIMGVLDMILTWNRLAILILNQLLCSTIQHKTLMLLKLHIPMLKRKSWDLRRSATWLADETPRKIRLAHTCQKTKQSAQTSTVAQRTSCSNQPSPTKRNLTSSTKIKKLKSS